MRNEKKFLAKWICSQLDKSNYVFLTDFSRITVEEVANLRHELRKEAGEFHVVKNSVLKAAADERSLPNIDDLLSGQTAIVVGGNNPSGVAKVLKKFYKDAKEEKFAIKGGILDNVLLSVNEINTLADLPSLDVLRAQLLSLLNTPAQKCVRLFNAVPQSMVNVLQAKVNKG
ncbi:MAG: 50S ribosomal protein L10 [Opitutales bacterium]|nr:50S ribosomal protein L10 [Opitutales bacterium]